MADIKLASVVAVRVNDISSASGMRAGAFEVRELADGARTLRGIAFRCPCGCGLESYLPLSGPGPVWTWDGNRELPTVNPSVLQVGGCRWHGYLRAGFWESC